MADRWATFDCYGTLIDWNGGIRATLAGLWPSEDAGDLLARYHEIEPRVQLDSAKPYRQILTEALELLAEDAGLELAPGDETALADSLPSWEPFPEVPGELEELRRRRWKLAILSNTDPDLLAASLERIGTAVDMTVTAEDARAYKPAHGHWKRFRERVGSAPSNHVHVAASLFHDIAPAAELGIPAVWINRLGETSDLPRAAELPDLRGLAAVLDEVARSATER